MLPTSNPVLAIAFMLLASVFIAATMVLAKALGTDALGAPLHPFQVTHGRFLFAFLGIAGTALVLRPRLRTRKIHLHLIRSAFGFLGVTLMFASVVLIPVSDATAISFLNPIFAMVLAIPLLGERVGPIRWIAAAIALSGALILLRPGPGTFQAPALLSLGAAMAFSVEITVMKLLSRQDSPLQIMVFNNAMGLVLASVAVLFVWQPPSAAQWGAMVALGGLMALAQACYVNAVARAEASLVMPFSYGTLVFAAAYDFAIFATVPDAVSVLGALVIVFGAVLLAWREARAHQRRQR